jgi:hypothetical protein
MSETPKREPTRKPVNPKNFDMYVEPDCKIMEFSNGRFIEVTVDRLHRMVKH